MTDDAPRTARAIARAELTAAIKAEARRQLAEVGPAALSLRAVARELGMVSSALYRYFASRDELLTALIIDAYEAVGAVAESAGRAETASSDPGTRWLAVCRAVREWALAHANEWALVYGSPVPGYAAPEDTIAPATRIGRVLAGIVFDALDAGAVEVPRQALPEPRVIEAGILEAIGGQPAPPHEDLVERAMLLWITLVGAISFEVFGHLENVVSDRGRFFDRTVAVAAAGVGIDVPLPGP